MFPKINMGIIPKAIQFFQQGIHVKYKGYTLTMGSWFHMELCSRPILYLLTAYIPKVSYTLRVILLKYHIPFPNWCLLYFRTMIVKSKYRTSSSFGILASVIFERRTLKCQFWRSLQKSYVYFYVYLAHQDHRSIWIIVINLHLSSYSFTGILHFNFFPPQTTGPIETDVNVTCVILNILYDICYIQNFNMADRPIMFYDCLHWT